MRVTHEPARWCFLAEQVPLFVVDNNSPHYISAEVLAISSTNAQSVYGPPLVYTSCLESRQTINSRAVGVRTVAGRSTLARRVTRRLDCVWKSGNHDTSSSRSQFFTGGCWSALSCLLQPCAHLLLWEEMTTSWHAVLNLVHYTTQCNS